MLHGFTIHQTGQVLGTCHAVVPFETAEVGLPDRNFLDGNLLIPDVFAVAYALLSSAVMDRVSMSWRGWFSHDGLNHLKSGALRCYEGA